MMRLVNRPSYQGPESVVQQLDNSTHHCIKYFKLFSKRK
uniref:Uncharacterized protein n=1 Tax=Rhizophora mucronata TaxID=61149 RepID=A0A2P2PPG0_RHIMU